MPHGDLYDAIFDEEAYLGLPALIAQQVGGRSCLLHRLDGNMQLIEANASYFDMQLLSDYVAAHPDGRDVWTQAGFDSGARNRSILVDTLVPSDQYRMSVLWNEVFRANGDDTGHSVGQIRHVEGQTLCVSVHCASADSPFNQPTADRLDTITADLHRIYRARLLLAERDGKIARLTQMLEATGASILLVGKDLRLIDSSPAADRMLQRGDGITFLAGRIHFRDSALAAAITRAAARTIDRLPVDRAAFRCERPSGAAPWRILVLPMADGAASRCMLIVEERPAAAGRLGMWLTGYYGATPAEVGVAEELLAGRTPEEISENRQVSINTIRTQIRKLLEKTGVRRMTQLIILLATLC